MFSLMTLPVTFLRALVLVVLLAVAYLRVLPKHRKAGLVMGAGGLFDLVASLGVPLMEAIGFGVMVSQGPGATGQSQPGSAAGVDTAIVIVIIMMVLQWIPPLAQAFNLGCFTWATWMLTGAIPESDEARTFS